MRSRLPRRNGLPGRGGVLVGPVILVLLLLLVVLLLILLLYAANGAVDEVVD
jgi:hypothetical protein